MTYAIGGYFELELPQKRGMLQDGILVNTGRNAQEYILRVRNYQHVYIPYYTCEVVLEPFNKLGIKYSFYHLDWNLQPTEYPELKDGEAFLYTNYFGLMDNMVKNLGKRYGNRLIVDNAQAFFSKVLAGDRFYSPRKFIGVPDGGVVALNLDNPSETLPNLEQDQSYQRMEHMLMRLDGGAEFGFDAFQISRGVFKDQPIKLMSNLTKQILESVEYDSIRERRKQNFLQLHQSLVGMNKLEWESVLTNDIVPMVYPLYLENASDIRIRLFSERIYPAQYWPNVMEWCAEGSVEHEITKNTLALPIDQRYGIEDMERIIKIICK